MYLMVEFFHATPTGTYMYADKKLQNPCSHTSKCNSGLKHSMLEMSSFHSTS